MNGFFAVVLVIMLIFAIRGWKRGLLMILFSLISVIVLIVLAIHFSPYVAEFLAGFFDVAEGPGGRLLTIVVSGIAAYLVIFLIGRALKLVNKIPVLGKINRFFGLLAGAAEGLILVWVIMTAIQFYALLHPDAAILAAIGENPFLTFLYENNPLVNFVLPGDHLPLQQETAASLCVDKMASASPSTMR